MTISVSQYRAAIGGFFLILNCSFTYFPGVNYRVSPSASSFNFYSCCSHVTLIIVAILILSMDIQPNPGPIQNIATVKLGLCHANVRSLMSDRSKLDDLTFLADSNAIDVITLSETWLSPNIPDCVLSLSGFQPIMRRDRPKGCGGGGCSCLLQRQLSSDKAT